MQKGLIFLCTVILLQNASAQNGNNKADSLKLFKENLQAILKDPIVQLLGTYKSDTKSTAILKNNGYVEEFETTQKRDGENTYSLMQSNVFVNSVRNPNPIYYFVSWQRKAVDLSKPLIPSFSVPLSLQWGMSKENIEALIGKPEYFNIVMPGYFILLYTLPYKNHADSIYKLTLDMNNPVENDFSITRLTSLRIELSTKTNFNEWMEGRDYVKKHGKEKPKPMNPAVVNKPIPQVQKPAVTNPASPAKMTASQYAHKFKEYIMKQGGVSNVNVYAGSSDYTRPFTSFAACASNGHTLFVHLFISDKFSITSSNIQRSCVGYDDSKMGSFTLLQNEGGFKVYTAKLTSPANAPRCQCNYTIKAQANSQFSTDMPMLIYYE
jgi:hypothetical protein